MFRISRTPKIISIPISFLRSLLSQPKVRSCVWSAANPHTQTVAANLEAIWSSWHRNLWRISTGSHFSTLSAGIIGSENDREWAISRQPAPTNNRPLIAPLAAICVAPGVNGQQLKQQRVGSAIEAPLSGSMTDGKDRDPRRSDLVRRGDIASLRLLVLP